MSTTGILAPPVRMYVSDKVGGPLIGGKMYSYEWDDKSTPKPLYKDINCTDPYPNPQTADATGCFPDLNTGKQMYCKSDSQYYLRFYDKDGNFINDSLAYPDITSSGGEPIVTTLNTKNLFDNADFKYRRMNKFFSNDIPGIGGDIIANSTPIADAGWKFYRTNNTATNTLEFVNFIAGQSEVPFNPKSYLNYKCTVAGSGELTKTVFKTFEDVNTLNGKQVSFSVYARSPDNPVTIKLMIIQYFGSGGSVVTITTQDIPITTSWTLYSKTNILIPTTSGKTVGTGSFLLIGIQYPNNSTCNIDFTIPQLNLGTTVSTYEYKTFEEEAAVQKTYNLPEFPDTIVNTDDITGITVAYDPINNIWDGDVLAFNAVSGKAEWRSPVPVGSWVGWFSTVAPTGGWFSLALNPGWLVKGIYSRLYYKWELRYGLDTTYRNNFTATVLNNVVTITAGDGRPGSGLGAMSHFVDNNTGWTFSTNPPGQVGDPTHQEITLVTCTSAANYKGGENFSFGTPSGSLFYVYIIIGGAGVDPGFSGKIGVPLVLNSSDSADVVASKLRDLFNPFVFYTPKYALGTFLRIWDHNQGNDPDRAARLPPPGGGWGAGDTIGTTQDSGLGAHTHTSTGSTETPLRVNDPGGVSDVIFSRTTALSSSLDFSGTASTNTVGQLPLGLAETRPKNVYTDIIFKY